MKTLAGGDALLAADVTVWLSFVLTQRNADGTEAFVRFVRERFPRLAGLFLVRTAVRPENRAPAGRGQKSPRH
jgi:hypothetical protein